MSVVLPNVGFRSSGSGGRRWLGNGASDTASLLRLGDEGDWSLTLVTIFFSRSSSVFIPLLVRGTLVMR